MPRNDRDAEHRSPAAVRLPATPQAALRLCLGGCGKPFPSRGPDNRICEPCKGRRSHLSREDLIGGRRAVAGHHEPSDSL